MEEGQLNPVEALPLTKDLLDSNKCFVLDRGAEIYVWIGRRTSVEERKAASVAAEVEGFALLLLCQGKSNDH